MFHREHLPKLTGKYYATLGYLDAKLPVGNLQCKAHENGAARRNWPVRAGPSQVAPEEINRRQIGRPVGRPSCVLRAIAVTLAVWAMSGISQEWLLAPGPMWPLARQFGRVSSHDVEVWIPTCPPILDALSGNSWQVGDKTLVVRGRYA